MEKKKMVKCNDLLENVKDQKARDWFLENIHEKEISERMLFTDEDNDIEKLFSIYNGHQQDEMHKSRIDSINKGTFDEQIRGGIYNVFMPDKNTYFHATIASDLTKQTLEILQHIKEVANKNGLKLEDLVPFKQLDNGEYGPKKNFLMLAIAKKYDSVGYSDFTFIPKMTDEKYQKEKDLIEEMFKNKSLKNSLKNFLDLKQLALEELEKDRLKNDRGIFDKKRHKDKYQIHDKALITWLIENVPDDCLKQKDGEGYNVVDYALMKMDKDILEQLLQKDKERNLGLLKNSKLLKRMYANTFTNEFTYDEAKKLLKNRYGVTEAIANAFDWNNQKKGVLKVLDTYIDNTKMESMEAKNNLKNTTYHGHQKYNSFG